MSGRRLKVIRSCATCAISFRPYKKHQWTCSPTCGAIRRVKLYPHTGQMHEANRKLREQFEAQLVKELEGKSNVEAYKFGKLRGYRSGYQRGVRDRRLGRVGAMAS